MMQPGNDRPKPKPQGQFMNVAILGRRRPRPRDPLSSCNLSGDEARPPHESALPKLVNNFRPILLDFSEGLLVNDLLIKL
jgi:hypothetical protein